MDPVVNGGVKVPDTTVVAKEETTKAPAKVAFKQDGDLQMQPPLEQDTYSSMPMVYDEAVAEKPKKSMGFGTIALTVAALAATTVAIIKNRKVSGLQDDNALLAKAAEEAKQKAAEAETKLKDMETTFNDLKPDDKLWHKGRRNMWNKLKEALFGDTKKAAENAKDDAKKTAEEAKDKAKDVADDAKDAAKD